MSMAPMTRQLPGSAESDSKTDHEDIGPGCGCVHVSPKVAAQMRGVTDLQHSPADHEQAARREVSHAEIEVDEELVTS